MNKEEINNLHILLYSHKQKAFHRMTLVNALNDNINSILGLRRADSDWIPVAVSDNQSKFAEIAESLRLQQEGTLPLQAELPVER